MTLNDLFYSYKLSVICCTYYWYGFNHIFINYLLFRLKVTYCTTYELNKKILKITVFFFWLVILLSWIKTKKLFCLTGMLWSTYCARDHWSEVRRKLFQSMNFDKRSNEWNIGSMSTYRGDKSFEPNEVLFQGYAKHTQQCALGGNTTP